MGNEEPEQIESANEFATAFFLRLSRHMPPEIGPVTTWRGAIVAHVRLINYAIDQMKEELFTDPYPDDVLESIRKLERVRWNLVRLLHRHRADPDTPLGPEQLSYYIPLLERQRLRLAFNNLLARETDSIMLLFVDTLQPRLLKRTANGRPPDRLYDRALQQLLKGTPKREVVQWLDENIDDPELTKHPPGKRLRILEDRLKSNVKYRKKQGEKRDEKGRKGEKSVDDGEAT